MKILNYKGIAFDDYALDENGHYWAEMCAKCAEKYRDNITNELDDGNTAYGICSIYGCSNKGENVTPHYYIDFDDNFISFEE